MTSWRTGDVEVRIDGSSATIERVGPYGKVRPPRRAGQAKHLILIGYKRGPFRQGRNLRSAPDGPDRVGTRKERSSLGIEISLRVSS